jgi:hypothetical protein
MKRYHMVAGKIYGKGEDPAEYGVIWEEDTKGGWVKYEDVISLLGAGMVCNCAEKVEEITCERPIESNPISPLWICPAHGYKRL